ncbi:hypothetical protein ACRN9L_01045, partial [Shewanella oncorhynchi]|uniref:hypothetical protein n=1 Tax=Shewanella oncorhynchi TaxID=2726434 RepID=UPI003D7BD199
FCRSITDAQCVRFCSWFIVPPLKKALCQSVGIIGMWDLLTAYGVMPLLNHRVLLALLKMHKGSLRCNTKQY